MVLGAAKCPEQACQESHALPLRWALGEVEEAAARGRGQDKTPWEEKLDKAVWHGARNNGHLAISRIWAADIPLTPRELVVQLAHGPLKGLLDASFRTSLNRLELGELFRYRYVVVVSGSSWASLLPEALASGSCVILQTDYAHEWFFPDLAPWEHYLPVRHDLSDLEDRIKWARAHPDVARRVAEAGAEKAKEVLTRAMELRHSAKVFEQLSHSKFGAPPSDATTPVPIPGGEQEGGAPGRISSPLREPRAAAGAGGRQGRDWRTHGVAGKVALGGVRKDVVAQGGSRSLLAMYRSRLSTETPGQHQRSTRMGVGRRRRGVSLQQVRDAREVGRIGQGGAGGGAGGEPGDGKGRQRLGWSGGGATRDVNPHRQGLKKLWWLGGT